MAAIRFLGSILLIFTVISFVADATRAFTTGPRSAVLTPLIKHWGDLTPTTLAAAQRTVRTGLHPAVWDWLLVPVLTLPIWMLLGLFAALLLYIGRRRRQVNIYTN